MLAPSARRLRASACCCGVEGRGAAHMLPALLCLAPAFCRAGADEVTFHIRQATPATSHRVRAGGGANVGGQMSQGDRAKKDLGALPPGPPTRGVPPLDLRFLKARRRGAFPYCSHEAQVCPRRLAFREMGVWGLRRQPGSPPERHRFQCRWRRAAEGFAPGPGGGARIRGGCGAWRPRGGDLRGTCKGR